MANKTVAAPFDQAAFLSNMSPDRRTDCERLLTIMQEITGESPMLWSSMVGFGHYSYRYSSGHSGEYFLVGFADRKPNLTLYLATGFEAHPDLMDRLGKYKIGKSCLYIKRLADIDESILKQLVQHSVNYLKSNYPSDLIS
jgi:Domain of unknown function (DU1801)